MTHATTDAGENVFGKPVDLAYQFAALVAPYWPADHTIAPLDHPMATQQQGVCVQGRYDTGFLITYLTYGHCTGQVRLTAWSKHSPEFHKPLTLDLNQPAHVLGGQVCAWLAAIDASQAA